MKLRWLLAVAGGFLLYSIAPAYAVEPYLEFVKGLRERDYHDYALLYLDQLEQQASLPKEIREVLTFERAITLLDGSRSQRNPESQTKQLDQARSYLEKFLAASPNHPLAGQANTELAQVLVGKGKVEVLQSRSPNNSGQKAEFQKKARGHFAEARKVFQAAHDRFKAEYDKYDKFIPKTEKAKYDAREAAYVHWIQAQFNLAQLIYEEAQTYDKGSADNKKLLNEAANTFEQIFTRYRQLVAGIHARMWQGKCFEEQDDITKALGIYDELLGHGGEKPTGSLKALQDRVLLFKLICLNHEKRKDYQLVAQTAQEWVKENRGALSTRIGLGIQWEMVRAEEQLGRKEGISETEKSRTLNQALATARAINRYPGEYKDVSTAMIGRLMVDLDREPGDPKDFATALGVGKNLIEDVRNRNKAIAEARGSERAKLVADLQPVLKEAARILSLGLTLVSTKDDEKEVNRARYFLSYVYFSLRDYSYDSAVLSEFIARKYTQKQPDLALDAAYLAQAAYIQAYNREPEKERAAEVQRVIAACNFITEHWPESDKANDARMNLGGLFSQMRRPVEAAKWYMQVPESAPQFLEAQLDAGNAFWYAYLDESIRPEAERKSAAELDEYDRQSREILQNAITRYEAQLPRDIAQVDDARLSNLTRARLSYAQILNTRGDYKGALGQLNEGPLSIIAAVAAPGGDEKKRPPTPSIRSRQFASIANQQVLRAYVGTQDLDKARATMKELEKIEGVGGGGAALTRIYLDLGKELEKEVKRLQSARDPRLGEVLKSFETFLDDMSNRKEGQDYNSLMWVAETYRALGDGLEEGDAAKSSGYFSRAVSALQMILDEEGKKPGFIPSGGQSGVVLRKVMCLRRQKSFDEARKLIVSVLKERPNALDAQIEAAQLYQDWGARGGPEDRKKWAFAIDGDQLSTKKKEKDKVVWGWSGIAQRLEASLLNAVDSNREHEKQYLDARYNVAWCRLQDAKSQATSNGREKLLEMAKRDVVVTATLSPDLGGEETWAKFNGLYRQVQQELVDAGLQKESVADLEKRERVSPGAKGTAAKGAVAKKGAKGPGKKSAKAGGPSKKPDAPKAQPSGTGNTLVWIVLGLVIVGGAGAGVWFFLNKKPKRSIASSTEDDAPPEPPRKQPPAKAKA